MRRRRIGGVENAKHREKGEDEEAEEKEVKER